MSAPRKPASPRSPSLISCKLRLLPPRHRVSRLRTLSSARMALRFSSCQTAPHSPLTRAWALGKRCRQCGGSRVARSLREVPNPSTQVERSWQASKHTRGTSHPGRRDQRRHEQGHDIGTKQSVLATSRHVYGRAHCLILQTNTVPISRSTLRNWPTRGTLARRKTWSGNYMARCICECEAGAFQAREFAYRRMPRRVATLATNKNGRRMCAACENGNYWLAYCRSSVSTWRC